MLDRVHVSVAVVAEPSPIVGVGRERWVLGEALDVVGHHTARVMALTAFACVVGLLANSFAPGFVTRDFAALATAWCYAATPCIVVGASRRILARVLADQCPRVIGVRFAKPVAGETLHAAVLVCRTHSSTRLGTHLAAFAHGSFSYEVTDAN